MLLFYRIFIVLIKNKNIQYSFSLFHKSRKEM